MSHTPFENMGSLRIGTVDFVSPDEVKVTLDIEAPNSVALNAGGARPFPRVNSYLLIPVDDSFLVGQIGWLTVERSAYPKQRGMQDHSLVELPYPLRKLSLNPLGTLRKKSHDPAQYIFRRGAGALPSIGAVVVIPTERQLRSIVESGEHRRVRIGTSPLAADARVCVDPNRLFGRHLAVLGNTGSGKSCSIAGLVRWSLEQARETCSEQPNARFIILDPNGEYSHAFEGEDSGVKARIFKVDPANGEKALKVPLWFWNSAEWCSFTQASVKTQRPLLKRALREVRAGRVEDPESTDVGNQLLLRRYLSSTLIALQDFLRSGRIKSKPTPFGYYLEATLDDLNSKNSEFANHRLDEICVAIKGVLKAKEKTFEKSGLISRYYVAFTEMEVQTIIKAIKSSLETLGGIIYPEGPDEDTPLYFNGSDLADHLEILAERENTSQFLNFLIDRIRTLLSDSRMNVVTGTDNSITLDQWLTDYIGKDKAEDGCVSVIDLSLVPTEVVHVVTAVIARMVFEALQRHMKINNVALPTVLVMDEAHTFIKRYNNDVDNHDTAAVCCKVFERIAREGRKFGLGLVISSQRPSELSPTVLSQCNTFLLHRITNDRDQELVHRLVPDNLRGLLRELPSLPSQSAILLGWASELPVLVKMNDLPESQRPLSDDPDFWGAWIGKDERGNEVPCDIDWSSIADNWQAGPNENSE